MKAGKGDLRGDHNAITLLWLAGGRDFQRRQAKLPVLMTAECRIDAVWRPGTGIALIELDGGGHVE